MTSHLGQTVSQALPLARTAQYGRFLAGTTCLIIGASSGIGNETAPFYRSPAWGAETVSDLATSPGLELVTGKYRRDKRKIRSAPVSYDREIACRLWSSSEQLTGLAGTKTPVSISPTDTEYQRFNSSIREHTP